MIIFVKRLKLEGTIVEALEFSHHIQKLKIYLIDRLWLKSKYFFVTEL